MDCVITAIEVTTPDNVVVTYDVEAGRPVPGPGLPDGPHDGGTYGRRDGAWVNVNAAALPSGGNTGDVLTKLSSADGDAAFRPIDDGVY